VGEPKGRRRRRLGGEREVGDAARPGKRDAAARSGPAWLRGGDGTRGEVSGVPTMVTSSARLQWRARRLEDADRGGGRGEKHGSSHR